MAENQKNTSSTEIKYQLAGWVLFIICAVLFITSSLRNHDAFTFIGSVFFLVACIVFLIPIIRKYQAEKTKKLNDKP